MKICLFFGSFNPIHIGHLIIANHVISLTESKKVWFIVSPNNPLKQSHTLLNEYNRLYLVRLAIQGDLNFVALDIEFKLPKPSYTIDTLTYIKEKYKQHDFAILIGSDSYKNLSKWKNYDQLIRENEMIVYKRPGFEVDIHENKIKILKEAPYLDISATYIRKMLQEGKSIKYLVTDLVMEEIEKSGYYKNNKGIGV